jgi:hypothetical protein
VGSFFFRYCKRGSNRERENLSFIIPILPHLT